MKVKFSEEQLCVDETMRWLNQCWQLTGAGDGPDPEFKFSGLQPNPFYERNALLTPAVVDQVIADMEGIFDTEIKKFPGYHNPHQGINTDTHHLVPAGFDQLPYPQRLAIVQGVDRIFQAHREEPAAANPDVDGQPLASDEGIYYGC